MTLVVVSGAPGTGKSTVGTAVAGALRWPLLSLDPVKEALADVLGLGGEDWSDRVGDAAAEVIFRLAAEFPDAVAEGWWRGTRRERAVREFAGAVEVFCCCGPELAVRRARERHGAGRHPIHRDVINPGRMLARVGELAGTVTPLGLGAALITVNTDRPSAAGDAAARVVTALSSRSG
jgi:predicted kinase